MKNLKAIRTLFLIGAMLLTIGLFAQFDDVYFDASEDAYALLSDDMGSSNSYGSDNRYSSRDNYRGDSYDRNGRYGDYNRYDRYDRYNRYKCSYDRMRSGMSFGLGL